MEGEGIRGLYLNYARGFKCKNFKFLEGLENLRLLNIIYPSVKSLSPVESLVGLRSLSISCSWDEDLNLEPLSKLEKCFIGYSKGAESIFLCKNLKYLYIDEFKLKKWREIGSLRDLEYLTIGNSNFSEISNLGSMHNLKKLVLLNCRKLMSLEGVQNHESLEWFTLNGSRKVESIFPLSALRRLRVLQLSNNRDIETLAPIEQLHDLEALCFFGDTNILDGDLKALESLDQLSLVDFANRKHYTHKPTKTWNWNDYGKTRKTIKRK